jgi:hypothetical protein
MNAMKNLAHAVVLLGWTVAGVLFSLKALFGDAAGTLGQAILATGGYWLWFAGLAAVTTVAIQKLKSPLGALALHAGLYVFLSLLPRFAPFGWLRLGLDLLASV